MTPEGLVEVRVSWSGHPRYQKNNNNNNFDSHFEVQVFFSVQVVN